MLRPHCHIQSDSSSVLDFVSDHVCVFGTLVYILGHLGFWKGDAVEHM